MLSRKDRNRPSPCLGTRSHFHLHMGHPQDPRIDSGTYRIIRSRVAVLDLFVPSADLLDMLWGLCVAILRRGLMHLSFRFMALAGAAEDFVNYSSPIDNTTFPTILLLANTTSHSIES